MNRVGARWLDTAVVHAPRVQFDAGGLSAPLSALLTPSNARLDNWPRESSVAVPRKSVTSVVLARSPPRLRPMPFAIVASTQDDSLFDVLRHVPVEDVILPLLIQIGLIIVAARVFAALFRLLGQPSVVGEIAAGLVLGPSVLGRLFPGAFRAVFHPTIGELPAAASDALVGWILTTLSQLGLVFLLFLIGLEFDFGHLKERGRAAMSISVMGVLCPFALGWGLAKLIHPHLEMDVNPRGFALFMGTAMSITAIPILGRMMMELNITRTRLGAITITAAAFDDATGWILLAAVSAMVRANFQISASLLMLAETTGFALGMIFVVRPLLCRWVRHALRRGDGDLGLNSLAILFVVLFACSIATNRIGIFAIFGAFLCGAVLSGEHDLRVAIARQLHKFVTVFFLPIFFTYTGLRTNIGTLTSPQLWLFAGAVSAAAIVGKFGGCSIAAWASGFSPREAACIGAMMNTRALMELIVINVGFELKVIPPSVFCMLVIMALLTTVMTTPILLRVLRGTELESHVAKSSFGQRFQFKESSSEPTEPMEKR